MAPAATASLLLPRGGGNGATPGPPRTVAQANLRGAVASVLVQVLVGGRSPLHETSAMVYDAHGLGYTAAGTALPDCGVGSFPHGRTSAGARRRPRFARGLTAPFGARSPRNARRRGGDPESPPRDDRQGGLPRPVESWRRRRWVGFLDKAQRGIAAEARAPSAIPSAKDRPSAFRDACRDDRRAGEGPLPKRRRLSVVAHVPTAAPPEIATGGRYGLEASSESRRS